MNRGKGGRTEKKKDKIKRRQMKIKLWENFAWTRQESGHQSPWENHKVPSIVTKAY